MSLCHKQPFLKSSKWAMKRGPWARVSTGWLWDYTVNKCEMCFSCDYLENFSKIYYCLYFRTSQNWICSRSPKKFYTVKLFRIYFFNSSIPIPKCGRGNNLLFSGILAFSQSGEFHFLYYFVKTLVLWHCPAAFTYSLQQEKGFYWVYRLIKNAASDALIFYFFHSYTRTWQKIFCPYL